MLKVILKRLKSETEEIIAWEQAGFSQERSTTGQIFDLRMYVRGITDRISSLTHYRLQKGIWYKCVAHYILGYHDILQHQYKTY